MNFDLTYKLRGLRSLSALMTFVLILEIVLIGLIRMETIKVANAKENAQMRVVKFSHESERRGKVLDAPLTSFTPKFPAFLGIATLAGDAQQELFSEGVKSQDFNQVPNSREVSAGINQIEISLRFQAEYHKTKKVLSALLDKHEELALRSLSISRERASDIDERVEVRIVTFYSK
jgi:hypothetical protein